MPQESRKKRSLQLHYEAFTVRGLKLYAHKTEKSTSLDPAISLSKYYLTHYPSKFFYQLNNGAIVRPSLATENAHGIQSENNKAV